MSYILQHPDFGLGNFINLTPAIRWLSEREQRRIPVFFTKDYVRECFVRCPFIEILNEQPDANPLFGSNLVNPNNDKPDYQYVFEYVTGEKWSEPWHTYVDSPTGILIDNMEVFSQPYGLIINGSGTEKDEYVRAKSPLKGDYVRSITPLHEIFKIVVATGSMADKNRCGFLDELADCSYWDNIRTSLMLIKNAACVIANDTGLAHAAGAMNQPLTVLVKDSPRERIKNPGKNTQYIYL